MLIPVAAEDLTLGGGGWTLSTVGGKKLLKVLNIEIKVIFSVVWPYFY